MRRLGSYQLSRMIGTGGMAQVWLGRRSGKNESQEPVAIKLLCAPLVHDPRYREMFQEEADLTIKLSHPNIVKVHELGVESGAQYIVMEWVDGMNLAHLSQHLRDTQKMMSIDSVVYIIGNLLDALVYVHSLRQPDGREMGLIHRDISPQNILIDRSGAVKLVDFGVARLIGKDTSGLHVKGKLRYMAPEQLHGDTIDQRADLYAVGAVLHELLSGMKFQSIQFQVPVLPEHLPENIRSLQRLLLNPDRELRLTSAREARIKLDHDGQPGNGRVEIVEHVANACHAVELKSKLPLQSGISIGAIDHESEDFRTVTETSTYMAAKMSSGPESFPAQFSDIQSPRVQDVRWLERHRNWIWAGFAVALFSALIALALLAFSN